MGADHIEARRIEIASFAWGKSACDARDAGVATGIL
jgi:hypothetical protein